MKLYFLRHFEQIRHFTYIPKYLAKHSSQNKSALRLSALLCKKTGLYFNVVLIRINFYACAIIFQVVTPLPFTRTQSS